VVNGTSESEPQRKEDHHHVTPTATPTASTTRSTGWIVATENTLNSMLAGGNNQMGGNTNTNQMNANN
jgi:hypothetical protein